MQPHSPQVDALMMTCPCCGVRFVIDDKTLGKLWGKRMKARRMGRPFNSRFAKMTAEERKFAAKAAAEARWAAHRAAARGSVAAPAAERPKCYSALAILDARGALIEDGEANA